MAKHGNMNVFILGKPIHGSRTVGSKRKTKRIRRGK